MSKLLAAPGARPEPIAIAFLLAAVVFLAFLSDASADAIPVSLGAPAISGAAWDIDKGDLDGDGDLDVVAAMTGPGYGLLWGENRGGTWFTRSISTGTEWRAVTTADIDGDGDLDVIAAGNSPLEVRAFLNINSGSSWSTNLLVSLGTVTDVPTLRVADLNGDGDLDLVVGTQTGGTGSLESYLQAGSLSNWANTTVWSTVVAPLDFALGDIDQDSDIDIVALDGNASGAGGIIRRYLNDGDGIGWMPSPLANSASVPSDVRLADMDDDGDLDAFVTIIGTNDLVWYENVFLGQWPLHTIGLAGTATRACEPVDMDGDGDLDVVGSSLLIGQFRWWENTDGVGDTWTQRVPLTSGVFAPQEMLTGDFDNDGDIDTVGITAANVAFFVNDRIHTTSTPDPADLAVSLSGPQDAFPIDIDRDGLLDLVTGSRGDDRVQWLRNVDGNGTWTIETVDTAFDGASVVGADIDRQGGIDIVGGSIDTGEVAWWANWATGFAKTTIATLPGLQQIAVGDLDGDSDIDVVVVGTGLLRWYENVNGDGSLWRITDLDIDALSGASSVAIGDLDGDGTMDIVHGSTGAPGVRVHAGLLGLVATGYGIQQPSLGALPVVTLADVNRDGELDMLVASGNDVLWLENDGGGVSFTARTVASGSTPAVRITTGDIDADGDIDVVTTHGGADDVVRWWSNDGAAMSWTERPLPGLVDDPVGVGIGDFDNDGGIDVAATASTGGSVYVWTSTRGQFSLDGSDVAPSTWVNGQMDAVLRIDANHLGRMPDGDAELTSLELAFDTPAFVPLTDSQLAAKVASVRVFHDADLSGDFDAALDDQVAFDGAPALSAGLLNVPLSPMVPFTYGAPETFFVVVELTATADQTPNIAVSHAPYAGDGSTARHEGVFFSDLSLGGSDTVTAIVGVSTDADGDGYFTGVDCDDADPAVNPGAVEVCDGIDNDCDALVDEAADTDGDGSDDCQDCAVMDPSTFPGATELCDGLDNDCDGAVPGDEQDFDGDGVSVCDGDCDDIDAGNVPGGIEICDGSDNDCDGALLANEVDADFDFFLACGGDCDDTDPNINPFAFEVCDGLDTNCDPLNDAPGEVDLDFDGVMDCLGDCDDGDSTIYPGALEICDGLDNDCDGSPGPLEVDADADAFLACGGDCDDAVATVFPGATELCDGLDNDCDGVVPAAELDGDGDGVSVCAGDCDDVVAAVFPGATEVCDGLDNDCDGVVPAAEVDGDGDGVTACAGDCDDAVASVFPGASELCDGLDNDCDGVVPANEADGDNDGVSICDGDCDDADFFNWPGNVELCDGDDNDCDGVVPADEIDGDGDGFLLCLDCDDTNPSVNGEAQELCDGLDTNCDGVIPANEGDQDGDGESGCLDCNDNDVTVYTGAPELCDGLDNDCDGVLSAAETGDGDGDLVPTCVDCDDADPTVYPGATEICNGIDDDCDGALPLFDVDSDGDGLAICQGDCNDADAAINPSATEVCNGVDDDCDGALPFAEQDLDGDGLSSCAGDCLDQGPGGLEATASPTVYPGAPELCDGYDNDCDGIVGNGILEWDSDLDGQRICQGDCDDNDATVYAGATEICNGIDDDCDGVTDNGGSTTDSDGDGVTTCAGDCDDNDAAVYPGATEVCDGTDNDCDGELELADVCVDSCGDGVVDNTPYFVPSCPNPGVVTQIGDRSELLAWAADPSTSANLRAAIDFSGFGLEVVTDCSLTSSAGADLSNADDVFIAAGSLDLAGSIEASGNVVLWGDTSADLRSSGTILGAEVAIEIPDLILRADVNSFGFCSEAVSFSHRGRSRVDLLGGDGIVYADDIDLRGDYQDIGNLTFIADVIDQRSNSSIDAAGDVLVDGGAVVDLEGVIAVGGILDVFANYVRLDTASAHTAVGSANYTSLGFSLMDLRGSVSSGGDVTIDAAGIYLRSSALIESNADVELTANGLFLGYGDIVQNGDVTIDSAVYYLGNGHDLSGNTSCTIGGFALWWGQSPNGCTAVP